MASQTNRIFYACAGRKLISHKRWEVNVYVLLPAFCIDIQCTYLFVSTLFGISLFNIKLLVHCF